MATTCKLKPKKISKIEFYLCISPFFWQYLDVYVHFFHSRSHHIALQNKKKKKKQRAVKNAARALGADSAGRKRALVITAKRRGG